MSIVKECDVIPTPSSPGLAEWQSEGDCLNQQDKSHAKTDIELEIRTSDKNTAKDAAIFRIDGMLLHFPKFL